MQSISVAESFRCLLTALPGSPLSGVASTFGTTLSLPATASGFTFFDMVRSVVSNTARRGTELLLPGSVVKVTSLIQQLIPERYEGDLAQNLFPILNSESSLPLSTAIPWLFALVAFFASNNNLADDQMDGFLKWIMEQKCADFLVRFMEIPSPTVHVFTQTVLESAIRIQNVEVFDALSRCGVKLEGMLPEIASLGNVGLTRRILLDTDPAYFRSDRALNFLWHVISNHQFDLARFLLYEGVSVDAQSRYGNALYRAVAGADMTAIKFLLDMGADPNRRVSPNFGPFTITPFGQAVSMDHEEAVVILLEHGADISAPLYGHPIFEWAALHHRDIFDRHLKNRLEQRARVFLLGDMVHAAQQGGHVLAAYIAGRQPEGVTAPQLEQALEKSIRRGFVIAAISLLQHGVDPNGPTLETRPLATAVDGLSSRQRNPVFVKLLLQHGADATQPGPYVLSKLAGEGRSDLLRHFLAVPTDVEQRQAALIRAACGGHIAAAAMLIRTGLDIDAHGPGGGLRLNPLQGAASSGRGSNMILFLLSKGANVNAPARMNAGRTALQSALEGDGRLEIAPLLLYHGADPSAPPASLYGVTTLEAFCHRCDTDSESAEFCGKLLDAGAPVNRPHRQPSSALHGVIKHGWHQVLGRLLEPRYDAIIDYMWCEEVFEDEDEEWRPRTPTQLASEQGDLEAVRILVEHGASANEDPGCRFGRTALQAAALLPPGPAKVELVRFLLDRGAEVDADPAPECGITALQGAAIAGDLMLAELLISRGADVNAWPSAEQGRTAIEGAAEHGRLDMVRLLLNAGAKGDVTRGAGFQPAIELAEDNGHFAVANLLEAHVAGGPLATSRPIRLVNRSSEPPVVYSIPLFTD